MDSHLAFSTDAKIRKRIVMIYIYNLFSVRIYLYTYDILFVFIQ